MLGPEPVVKSSSVGEQSETVTTQEGVIKVKGKRGRPKGMTAANNPHW